MNCNFHEFYARANALTDYYTNEIKRWFGERGLLAYGIGCDIPLEHDNKCVWRGNELCGIYVTYFVVTQEPQSKKYNESTGRYDCTFGPKPNKEDIAECVREELEAQSDFYPDMKFDWYYYEG